MPEIAFWIGGVAVALLALDRFLLGMEARGWIYWRKVKRGSAGGGFLLGANVFESGPRHLEEAREERTAENAEDGDDDGKRKSYDRLT